MNGCRPGVAAGGHGRFGVDGCQCSSVTAQAVCDLIGHGPWPCPTLLHAVPAQHTASDLAGRLPRAVLTSRTTTPPTSGENEACHHSKLGLLLSSNISAKVVSVVSHKSAAVASALHAALHAPHWPCTLLSCAPLERHPWRDTSCEDLIQVLSRPLHRATYYCAHILPADVLCCKQHASHAC